MSGKVNVYAGVEGVGRLSLEAFAPDAPACPRGLCDGSGTLAPHPVTMGADAGVDDPCPCREAVAPMIRVCEGCGVDIRIGTDEHSVGVEDGDYACSTCQPMPLPAVSPLEAAWAKVERCEDDAAAAISAGRVAYAEALAIGPRPVKVPTRCRLHATGGHAADDCDEHTARHAYGYGPGEWEPT